MGNEDSTKKYTNKSVRTTCYHIWLGDMDNEYNTKN